MDEVADAAGPTGGLARDDDRGGRGRDGAPRPPCVEGEGAPSLGRDDARFVLENIPLLVWRSRADGLWTWGGPQWTAFTGQSDARSRGRGWLDAVHPDDRERTVRAWAAASRGEPSEFTVEHRLRRVGDGVCRWFQTRAVPRHDLEGALEWFGISTDVDDLKSAQSRETALLNELRERVRASLATVRALVRAVGEAGDEGEAVELRLGGRLDALARVQSALIRDPFGGIDLGTLLAEELRLAGVREGGRVHVTGPRVALRPRAAETVALALHELTTNAAEHGALARADGQLAVSWRWDEGRAAALRLDWAETERPGAVTPPDRHGFGLDLLSRALPRALGAGVGLSFAPTGFSCRIDLPAACCLHRD